MKRLLLVIPAVMLMSVSVQMGCSPDDVPFVVDADEIRSYIANEPEAKELFSTNGLYPDNEYPVPFLLTFYQDRLLSHRRTISVQLVPTDSSDAQVYVDYGNLGFLREALAIITDRFTIETTRMSDSDTLVDTTSRQLVRYGFFLKMGSDSQPYVGWRLWGYRGIYATGGPLATTMRIRINGSVVEFQATTLLYDQVPLSSGAYIDHVPYVRLSDIPKPDANEVIALETNWVGSHSVTYRDYPLVAFQADSGFYTSALSKISRDQYRGAFDVHHGTERRYNFIFMQSFHDHEFFHTSSWCVPYQQ